MSTRIFSRFLLACVLLFTACRKDDVASRDYQSLGSSARDLLSSTGYTALQVEVSYMPGYEPEAAALAGLKTFLEQYLDKPGGVQVTTRAVAASGKTTLALSDVVSLEKKYRTAFTGGRTVAVHILLADADYSDPQTLALSYWNTSFCLFGKTVYARSGGSRQASRATLETILLEHEFGHLLGLVGQGSPEQAPHRDAANGAHCTNRSCLMYYAVETFTAYTNLPVLDAPCAADLKANGGR